MPIPSVSPYDDCPNLQEWTLNNESSVKIKPLAVKMLVFLLLPPQCVSRDLVFENVSTEM